MNNQTRSIKIIDDDDYFEADSVKQQQLKLKGLLNMELPKENNPMWHYIQRIIQEVETNGYYEEHSSSANKIH